MEEVLMEDKIAQIWDIATMSQKTPSQLGWNNGHSEETKAILLGAYSRVLSILEERPVAEIRKELSQ